MAVAWTDSGFPHGMVLVDGGLCIEISVLISADGGATFDELDESLLIEDPIRLLIGGIWPEEVEMPAFFSYPTFIASDAVSGIGPVAEPGAWEAVTTVTLGPVADDAHPPRTYARLAQLRTILN